MLPTTTDNGARLAAILPTGLAALGKGLGFDPANVLEAALGGAHAPVPEALPALRSLVLVVVDGLGSANLRAAKAHAPVLTALAPRRIETVVPSTTGAALTSLATGRLPGAHGLIGYRIRHPELGLRSTLKEWHGIDDVRSWQLAAPLWPLAEGIGARAVAIGRSAHATGGLTEAILSGTEYHAAQTIAERFAVASGLLREGAPTLAYLYIDELDRAGHHDGWQSEIWQRRLGALDRALDDLLRTLPGDTGVLVTADHGMIDVPGPRMLIMDQDPIYGAGGAVAQVGGEPRMRSLYLAPGADADEVSAAVRRQLGKTAWVGTRDEAIAADWFGPVAPGVADRLGEVLVTPRGQTALMLSSDQPAALAMVGQHGGLSAEERGVPLALGGALAGTGFAAAVTSVSRFV
ncbi:MAG: alkaline phosphatase family protein [Leucobacter sp.]|nr:alkaline phosphatase family protein [Leucobacter sp.]